MVREEGAVYGEEGGGQCMVGGGGGSVWWGRGQSMAHMICFQSFSL